MKNGLDHKDKAIVLRWVKYRESDAIIKMVNESGFLVEAIARGVRKPKNSSSSKLEVLNCIEGLFATSKGLDIVKDCKVVSSNDLLRQDPCKFACASCLTELLSKTLQPNIHAPSVFDLTLAYLGALEEAPDSKRLSLTAAALLKASAYLGFMPSLIRCAICGNPINDYSKVALSYEDGGAICQDCKIVSAHLKVDPQKLKNASAFLHTRFSDMLASDIDDAQGIDVLELAISWLKAQAQVTLKSYPLALQMCQDIMP